MKTWGFGASCRRVADPKRLFVISRSPVQSRVSAPFPQLFSVRCLCSLASVCAGAASGAQCGGRHAADSLPRPTPDALSGVCPPRPLWGRPALVRPTRLARPARRSDPVSNACREMHSNLRLRRRVLFFPSSERNLVAGPNWPAPSGRRTGRRDANPLPCLSSRILPRPQTQDTAPPTRSPPPVTRCEIEKFPKVSRSSGPAQR